MAELRDWVFFSGCFAHSFSNAIKWGLKSFLIGGEDQLDGIHITVSSFIRASKGFIPVVSEFIASYVVLDLDPLDNTDDLEWIGLCLMCHRS